MPTACVVKRRHIVEEGPDAVECFLIEHALGHESREHLIAAVPQCFCGIVEEEGENVICLYHRLWLCLPTAEEVVALAAFYEVLFFIVEAETRPLIKMMAALLLG